MKTVGDVAQYLRRQSGCVSPDTSVGEALQIMANQNLDALPVVDEGIVVGVLSERDFARKLVMSRKSPDNTRASEIMTGRIARIDCRQQISDTITLMKNKQIRYFLVYDGAELSGLITISDIFQAVIEDQQHTIDQLEDNLAQLYQDLATMSY